MNLRTMVIWRRLSVMLAYHEKLVMENRDKRSLTRAANKVKRLTCILEALNRGAKMKALILLLSLSIVVPVGAHELQYQPPAPAPVNSQNSHSNVVPVTLIVGAVVTTGYLLFRAHKTAQKKSMAIRYNLVKTN